MESAPSRDDPKALARAADPRTPPRELDDLAEHGGRDVRAAVAGNPNASFERLIELSCDFPQEVLDNDALALLWVAESEHVREVASNLLLRVCESPDAPAEMFEIALKKAFLSPSVATKLVRSPALPPTVVERLGFNCPWVLPLALRHPNMPADIVELWRVFRPDEGRAVGAPGAQARPAPSVSEAPATAPHTLERCMSLGPLGSELVAMSPSASPEQIARLVERAVMAPGNFIAPLAARGDLTREQAEYLVDHVEPSYIDKLASGLRGFDDLLERLATDPAPAARGGVATNLATPAHLLERLAADPENAVRREAARNPSTPPNVLGWLTTDPDGELRNAAAMNPSTPVDTLAKLASPEVTADEADRWFTSAVIAHLGSHPSAEVRAQVARRAGLSPELFERLARDPDERVRQAIESNPHGPSKAIAPGSESRTSRYRRLTRG